VPESVENDLAATGLSFGFNTALAFTVELLDRVRQAARSGRRVAVVEVLGQFTGWLALQGGTAALADAVLIPEIPYDPARVAARLTAAGASPALVVVAEGARAVAGANPDGRDAGQVGDAAESRRRALSPGSEETNPRRVIERAGATAEAVAAELRRRTSLHAFPFALDQLLRGGRISATDRQLGLAYGAAAVRGLHAGQTGAVVAFHPPKLEFVPLGDAVNKTRPVPADSHFVLAARALGISLGDE
jgi:ATP-dependent phosphofructokinase / diphosphate-dependent phosphofructokinase